MVICEGLDGQTSISLRFSAEINGIHQPLDSIRVQNITRETDTTLYGNDTVLMLDCGTGASEWGTEEGSQMIFFSPFPNPITQSAAVRIWLPRDSRLTLLFYDIQGRVHQAFDQPLHAGYHLFMVHPGNETFYVLVAEADGVRLAHKLINQNQGSSQCQITYSAWQPMTSRFRTREISFPWAPGDSMRYVGFAASGFNVIVDNPNQSSFYTFKNFQPLLPLVANFSVSDTLITKNDTVQFTDFSTGNLTAWKWFFGDGAGSEVQNPVHVYTSAGIFNVTLIVNDPFNADTLNIVHCIMVGNGIGSTCPGVPVVVDFNGNVYNTVQIGTQCWMKENLKTSNYRNGTLIPHLSVNPVWFGDTTGGMCWYNNDSATYTNTYGALYDWYAVTKADGLCPLGWHVPTDLEWQALEIYHGVQVSQVNSTGFRSLNAGGKMKSTRSTPLAHPRWSSPNTYATNSEGFEALPGGIWLTFEGEFRSCGSSGVWWTSTSGINSAIYRELYYNSGGIRRDSYSMNSGFSVRCVKD